MVFDTVFGRDYRVTCAIWEFSKNCHLRTVAVRNMRKSVFWRLQLYFWAYSPHIWNIDAYWHLCTYRSPITRSITELHEQKDKENSFLFWRLQLYFWAYSPHIWNIDAYWHLKKTCPFRFLIFSFALAKKPSIAQKSFSLLSPLLWNEKWCWFQYSDQNVLSQDRNQKYFIFLSFALA